MRRKSRLTITLPKDMIVQIDGMVDHIGIKNRSHAIEELLRSALVPRVTEAVILGGGTKFSALKIIKGRTLIETMIRQLTKHGITRMYLVMGKHNNQVKKILDKGRSLGAAITYVDESKPSGTGGAIKLLSKMISKPFVVLHGDVLTDINLSECIKFHQIEKTVVTMAVKPRSSEISTGKVLLEGNKIIKFVGKTDDAGISIVNTGVYVMNPEIFNFINHSRASLETEVFPVLAQKGELTAYLFQGVWFDISSDKNYKLALERWE